MRLSHKKCIIDGDFGKSLKLLSRLIVKYIDGALVRDGFRPFD